jgi:hypothetical protein
MGLLLAANNKATRRNERNNKKLTSIEFKPAAFLNKQLYHGRNGLLPSTDRFLVPENILHTGFTEKALCKDIKTQHLQLSHGICWKS